MGGADVGYGLLAIVVGALFCFQGYLALRILIPIWGALAGFSFGAGLVASISDERFLSTALGWIVGLVLAIVFGLLAYLYYAVSVVIAMGFLGFVIGTSVMYALNVSWEWLVVLVGAAAGVLLAFLAVVADLPMVLLVARSALGGAERDRHGVDAAHRRAGQRPVHQRRGDRIGGTRVVVGGHLPRARRRRHRRAGACHRSLADVDARRLGC